MKARRSRTEYRNNPIATAKWLNMIKAPAIFYLFTFKKASPPNRADSLSSSLVRDMAT